MNEIVGRVQTERRLRGWSIRRCAQEIDNFISNQTWSVFEKTGVVTDGVRTGVKMAFGWPDNWPEQLPVVTLNADEVVVLRGRVAELDLQVQAHARQLKELGAAVKRLQRPPRRSTAESP